jgi:8-oxo-dGTP diphosphatase
MTHYLEVAAGLVFRNGLLLITQRRWEDDLGGLWEFPGGKRQPPETFEACLERELKEELDIQVQVQELLEIITYPYPDKTVHLRFFRCAWRRHEPRPLECHAVAWVKREDLAHYRFPAADAQLLRKLQESPELWR